MADSGSGCGGCLVIIVVFVLISSASRGCSSKTRPVQTDGSIWSEIHGEKPPYSDELKDIEIPK
jgi:hypothetical protein